VPLLLLVWVHYPQHQRRAKLQLGCQLSNLVKQRSALGLPTSRDLCSSGWVTESLLAAV
jgi:hypothetical protein